MIVYIYFMCNRIRLWLMFVWSFYERDEYRYVVLTISNDSLDR